MATDPHFHIKPRRTALNHAPRLFAGDKTSFSEFLLRRRLVRAYRLLPTRDGWAGTSRQSASRPASAIFLISTAPSNGFTAGHRQTFDISQELAARGLKILPTAEAERPLSVQLRDLRRGAW